MYTPQWALSTGGSLLNHFDHHLGTIGHRVAGIYYYLIDLITPLDNVREGEAWTPTFWQSGRSG